MTIKTHLLLAVCAGSFLASLGHAKAVKLNSWQSAGDIVLGPNGAELSTASATEIDDDPSPAGAFNLSGSNPWDTFSLESALGLGPGSLDPDAANGAYAFEGSAIWGDINYTAGQTFSFSWQLSTNETAFPDYAFVSWNGLVTPFATAALAATPSSPFMLETSKNWFKLKFNSSGSGTLGIGILDTGDFVGSTKLSIDSASVPDGGSVTGVLAGLLGLLVFVRSRRIP